jgi:hypothetical protein
MNDNEKLRRNWRTNWLSSIQEFADEQTQRGLWLDPENSNPHHSYGEYVCCYFDDLGLSEGGYGWALEQGIVSADEVAAVTDFHAIAGNYKPADVYNHEAILADPGWAGVVAAAKRAQSALLGLIKDPRERQLLTEP